MAYLPNGVDEKLISVMCDLSFTRLRGASVGGYSPRNENVPPAERDSFEYGGRNVCKVKSGGVDAGLDSYSSVRSYAGAKPV